jgi:hypothetical protein
MKFTIQFLATLALIFTMVGCGWFDRKVAAATGGATKTCVDGVTYLQFTSGATVQVDVTGKPVACKE